MPGTDTYESMGYSRGASALGVAVALGDLTAEQLSNEKICSDWPSTPPAPWPACPVARN